ncbi:MAG: transporter substrate-binding protein [Hydrocarboniphaga sp.]|uniref:ABC transporter substrate-binding protein n=1 Tax=Hydrocarboniphaga sp. TaxID=2033016 RepID=UPI0026197DEA|nr:ABC transporter substrate binding protein [Hydrocarboniphaga sp.]MDB5972354.1 transporter substrate-binding protein [Hydrocarboniphaga sp.]
MSYRHRRRFRALLRKLAGTALLCSVPLLAAQAGVLLVRDAEVAASKQFVDELGVRLSTARMQKQVSVVSQDFAAGYQRLHAAAADDDDETAFAQPPRTRSLGALMSAAPSTADEHQALQAAPADLTIVVAVGPAALRAALQRPAREPVVAVLVSRSEVEEAYSAADTAPENSSLYAIVTNQPARRQLSLIVMALPDRHRIGVVYPPDAEPLLAEVQAEAQRLGVGLVARRSDSAAELSAALAEVLPISDVLLLLADPVSLAAGVAQNVLRSAAASRKPVVASTEAMVRAGALLGVYTTRAQFVDEAADYVARLQKGERPPPIAAPRRFSVGVNSSVAHALALDVPDELQLQRKLTATP